MTLRDVCDAAYVLLREQIASQVTADRQGLLASGVRRELPSVQDELDAFDARLLADETGPTDRTGKPITAEQMRLRRALGVA